jgi:YD repeat-containing protein
LSTPVGGSLTTRVLTYPGTSNRMSKVTIGAATERDFTYDAAGNIATDTRSGTLFAYGYNARNRLETVTVAGSLRGTYTTNGLEQLAIRVLTNMTPSGTTHFVHGQAGRRPRVTAKNPGPLMPAWTSMPTDVFRVRCTAQGMLNRAGQRMNMTPKPKLKWKAPCRRPWTTHVPAPNTGS